MPKGVGIRQKIQQVSSCGWHFDSLPLWPLLSITPFFLLILIPMFIPAFKCSTSWRSFPYIWTDIPTETLAYNGSLLPDTSAGDLWDTRVLAARNLHPFHPRAETFFTGVLHFILLPPFTASSPVTSASLLWWGYYNPWLHTLPSLLNLLQCPSISSFSKWNILWLATTLPLPPSYVRSFHRLYLSP